MHKGHLHGQAIQEDPILLRDMEIVQKRTPPDPVQAQANP